MACCDRCEITVNEFGDNGVSDVRLQEIHMSFGITTCLCFECRKAWAAFSYNHDLFNKYAQIGFRYKAWKIKYRNNPAKVAVEDGLVLLNQLQNIEVELHNLAKNWIRAGMSAGEKAKRKDD